MNQYLKDPSNLISILLVNISKNYRKIWRDFLIAREDALDGNWTQSGVDSADIISQTFGLVPNVT